MPEKEVEIAIANGDIPTWQTGLSAYVNQTYSYSQQPLFYALAPTYLRDYLVRYIRPCIQWLDGYVPSLHQAGASGIISTRIAHRLITGLTKQIVGEKLIFKPASKNYEESKETLSFVNQWYKDNNIQKAVYSAIGFSLGIGTSMLKLNRNSKDEVWWEGVRFDNCFYLGSFTNEVREATFCIRGYGDTREGKSNQQFFLVEHRYYKELKPKIKLNKITGQTEVIHKKGDKIAMVRYEVHRCLGTSQNNLMPSQIGEKGINWQEIPQEIRDFIKRDYGTLRINEEQPLGFTDLGCYPLLNGYIDLSVPTGSNYGESLLIGILDDLMTYELASSYLIRDMYLGKGTVYVPKGLNLTDVAAPNGLNAGGVLNGIGESKIEYIKGVSPEEQKITSEQFAIRVNEFQQVKENALKNIAVKWGMTPKILASFLTQGQAAATATQIDSEDDAALAFIYHTRAYFVDTLNKALETTLNYYGIPTNVSIEFASPSLLNKDRILDRTLKELESGLIDLDDAVRTMNPDDDEEVIQEKIEKARAKQQEQMLMAQTEMQPDGSFLGESEGDLDGSTIIG